MLLTKQLMLDIDFHSTFSIVQQVFDNQYYSNSLILYSTEKTTGLAQIEGELSF